MKKELTALRRRRGVIKCSLTRIRNYIVVFNPKDMPISLLEFRQEELPRFNSKFDEVQSQIVLISEEVEQEEEERNLFEIDYFNARSQIYEIVKKSLNSSVICNQSMGASRTYANIAKLAPGNSPFLTFSGNIQLRESYINVSKI